jgi:hypothetical protein
MCYGLRFGLQPIPVEVRRVLPLHLMSGTLVGERPIQPLPLYDLVGCCMDPDSVQYMLEDVRCEGHVARTYCAGIWIGVYVRVIGQLKGGSCE